MTGLLHGVRVVDLSRVLAGPFAAQILGEMGADVIKVEPPEGDMARGIGPHIGGRSLYFSSLNTNKRGVVLDLRDPIGRRALESLLATADIVVENFRPSAIAKLGLSAEGLIGRHPRLVVLTISSYARETVLAEEGSFDLVAQAESGVMSLTGEEGGSPVRAGVAIADLAAGLWGSLGAVAAYSMVLREGRGRHVETPLLDSAVPLLSYVATAAMGTGTDPEPVGSGHHNIVPYRAYPTADGWVVVAVLGDKFWGPLCDALGLEEVKTRADLRTNTQRVAARAEVDHTVAAALCRLSTEEAIQRLASAGIPHGRLNSVLQALATPYVQSRGIVSEVNSPEGTYGIVHSPLWDGSNPIPAPALGEHTVEVMREVLGEDSPDLRHLMSS